MNIYEQQRKKLARNKEKKLKDKDLFGPYFQDFCQKWAETLTGRNTYHVTVSHDPRNPDCGHTDGREIFINAGHLCTKFYKRQEQRFNAVLGVLFHEAGHCNDPKLLTHFQKTMEKVAINNECVIAARADFSDVEREVFDAFSAPEYKPVIVETLKQLMNIALDAHDEAAMTANFNSFIGDCLNVSLAIDEASTQTLQQMRKDDADDFAIVMSLIFEFVRFGKFIMEDTDEAWNDPAVLMVCDMCKSLDVLRVSDEPEERNRAAFDAFVALWPLLKDQIAQTQNQQNGQNGNNQSSGQGQGSNQSQNASQGQNGGQNQSGGQNQNNAQNSSQSQGNGQSQSPTQQQGSGQGQSQNQQSPNGQGQSPMSTAQAASAVASAIQQLASGFSTPMPMNMPQGGKSLQASGGQQGGGQGQGDPQAQQQVFSQFCKSVATAKADEELEKQVSGATSDFLTIIETENACSSHKGRRIKQVVTKAGSGNEAHYERICSRVKPYVNRLVAELKLLFEDLRTGSIARGRNYGRVDSKSFRRVDIDQQIFAQKKNPIDIPDMAICLLLDQSGSMSGSRMAACEEAAILLEAVASQLDIPIMVCGHNTINDGIAFYVHRDFDTIDKRRKFCLADIPTGGCNRDGFAIYVASEYLGSRPEEDKLLFIISDGQPNDDNYGGDLAKKDIQQIVAAANRKYGIETIAAAIGNDKDRIKEIYKTSFLDISDLSRLPKTLANIIRARLER